MQTRWILIVGVLSMSSLLAAGDVAVPSTCSADVNAKLAGLVAHPPSQPVDNVMVCGTTISASRTQRGGRHGAHDLLPLVAPFPDGTTKLVEVVINEDLDGRITAPVHVPVFAYGQAYFDNTGHFVAGIHDVHCSTHRGADNGWVVVNGAKSPAGCPAR